MDTIRLLDSENADYNLTAIQTVLTHTPDTINPTLCIGLIKLGDATKGLDGTGGIFSLYIMVGGQSVEPYPQPVRFSAETRASAWTTQFAVPAGDQVLLQARSPNAADVDVDVTAYLYKVLAEVGAGSVSVDHDYGGVDNLRYITPAGIGIDNAIVRAYLEVDFLAGRRQDDYIKGRVMTNVTGRWANTMRLDPEVYQMEFSKQGSWGPDVKEVTVT